MVTNLSFVLIMDRFQEMDIEISDDSIFIFSSRLGSSLFNEQ